MRALISLVAIGFCFAMFSGTSKAETLLKNYSDETGVHYGTPEENYLCCHCKVVLESKNVSGRYERKYRTRSGTIDWGWSDNVYQSLETREILFCPTIGSPGNEDLIPSCLIFPAQG